MAETKKHSEIPLQNPEDVGKTFGQKIEEPENHFAVEITETAKEISELKNEIEAEIKLAEKATRFLDKNPSFEMEIKNKIHDLRNAPVDEPKKTIYENTLFFLETGFRKLLVFNLKETVEGADLQEVAEKFTKEFIDALEKMADGPTLEYHELLPKENEVYAPEVRKLLEDSQFLREAGELAESPDKKEFISAYLKKWAAVSGEANVESTTRFLNEARAMLLQSVGGGHLTREEFREIWEKEISRDPAAAKLLEKADSETSENFNEWLHEKETADIVDEFEDEEYRRKNAKYESNSNPYGFLSRKWGSLGSAFLYFGKDILAGVILVNLALAKFNPLKLLSNPVAWATVGGVGLIADHFNPLSPKTPDVKEAAKEDLKNKIESLQERNSTVWQWLVKFGESDLAENGEIGRLLAEKGRSSIASAEIKKFLAEDELPESEILEKSAEAGLLFKFFKACQNENIDPKNLENV